MGLCKLPCKIDHQAKLDEKSDKDKIEKEPYINRRIDIKVYPKSQFPFAILYFTGSAYFNRSMRLFA